MSVSFYEHRQEWSVSGDNIGKVYLGDNVANRFTDRCFQGNNFIREFHYTKDKKNSFQIGWLVIDEGVFAGVEVVKYKEEEYERKLNWDLMLRKYKMESAVTWFDSKTATKVSRGE